MSLAAGLMGLVGGVGNSVADREVKNEEALRQEHLLKFKSDEMRAENDRQYDRDRTDAVADRDYRESREDELRIEGIQAGLDKEQRNLSNAKDLYSYQQRNKATTSYDYRKDMAKDLSSLEKEIAGSSAYINENERTAALESGRRRIRQNYNDIFNPGSGAGASTDDVAVDAQAVDTQAVERAVANLKRMPQKQAEHIISQMEADPNTNKEEVREVRAALLSHEGDARIKKVGYDPIRAGAESEGYAAGQAVRSAAGSIGSAFNKPFIDGYEAYQENVGRPFEQGLMGLIRGVRK